MALNNYQNLVQSVINRSFRNDITTDLVDEFIQLCEQDFIYGVNSDGVKLRVREMQELARNTVSTNDRYLALPDRYLSMIKLVIYPEIVGLDGFADEVKDSYPYSLTYLAPEAMNVINEARFPSYYTITNQIEFNTLSDQRYAIEVNYLGAPLALSSTNQTNDVLTNYPNIYLFGTLFHLYEYVQEPVITSYWKNAFTAAIDSANEQYYSSSLGPSPTTVIEEDVP